MEELFTAIRENDGLKLDGILTTQAVDFEKQHRVNEEGEERSYTPLQYAAKLNRIDIADYLLFAGANVNTQGAKGRTALHLAVSNQHTDMAILLLKEGANPNLLVTNGMSILFEPIRRGNIPLIRALVEAGANVNANEYVRPLTIAIGFENLEVLRYLIEKGADVNAQGCIHRNQNARSFPPNCHFVPLIQAIVDVHNEAIIHLLLDRNADVNANHKGTNVLSYAVRISTPEIVRALLEKGANVNAQTPHGFTPLMFAVTRIPISLEILRILCEFGANKMLVNRFGKTALVFAERIENEDTSNDALHILQTCGITDPSLQRSNTRGINQNSNDPETINSFAPNTDPQGGKRRQRRKTHKHKHKHKSRRSMYMSTRSHRKLSNH